MEITHLHLEAKTERGYEIWAAHVEADFIRAIEIHYPFLAAAILKCAGFEMTVTGLGT